MTKQFVLGVLAYVLPTFPLGYFWHLTIFKSTYEGLQIYRDDIVIPFGLAAMLIQGAVWSYIYGRLFAGENVLRGALKFAAVAAPLAWTFMVLAVGAKHHMTSVPRCAKIHPANHGLGTMLALQSALGIVAIIGFAWLISENRGAVSWRRVAIGIAGCIVLAALFLKLPPAQALFAYANSAVTAVADASKAGTSFVFGYLGGGTLPFELKIPGAEFVLAFQALPIVLVMSVMTTLLFYWGILPPIVRGFSWALERTLGVGGAVGVSAAANIFVGHVEAPLFIRPYLARLSRGELFVVMTGGMAGIAGTVLVLYTQFLSRSVPDAAGHFIIASVLSAPLAVLIGQIMVPDGGTPTGSLAEPERVADSTMDAIATGTTAGLQLLLNMIAMLIVFVALVHLVNAMLGLLPAFAGEPLTLQRMLGWIMAPVTWLIGIPWAQAQTAGALMGIKTILNELIAYLEMSKLPADALDARSRLIMLYAMCGFANFGSLGIMIGGLSVMAPERRDDVLAMGMKSIVSGTLATLLMGAIVGLLHW